MSSIAAKWPPRSGVSGSNQRVPLEGDTGEAEGKWRPPQGADILGGEAGSHYGWTKQTLVITGCKEDLTEPRQ